MTKPKASTPKTPKRSKPKPPEYRVVVTEDGDEGSKKEAERRLIELLAKLLPEIVDLVEDESEGDL